MLKNKMMQRPHVRCIAVNIEGKKAQQKTVEEHIYHANDVTIASQSSPR